MAPKQEKPSIDAEEHSVAQACSPELDLWLEEWFLPTLQGMTVMALSWERLIGDIRALDPSTGKELTAFYNKCLEYN
jgi:hypothetical protein